MDPCLSRTSIGSGTEHHCECSLLHQALVAEHQRAQWHISSWSCDLHGNNLQNESYESMILAIFLMHPLCLEIYPQETTYQTLGKTKVSKRHTLLEAGPFAAKHTRCIGNHHFMTGSSWHTQSAMMICVCEVYFLTGCRSSIHD